MIGYSLTQGNKLNKVEWIGFGLAFGGLVFLLLPGLSAPPINSALLMMFSGISWGAYSLLGNGVTLFLAVISGSLTSGVGYVLWYLTLRQISTTIASIVQLSVPIIAALGGVLFISEDLSVRLIIATLLIFGGIFLTIKAKKT